VPRRMLVIGGGVIGLELGMVYQKLGSEIVVVEATPGLLPGIDPELTAVVEKKLVKLGGKVHKSAKALGYEKDKDGALLVKLDLGEGKHDTVTTDCVLVAVPLGLTQAASDLARAELPDDVARKARRVLDHYREKACPAKPVARRAAPAADARP